MCTELELQQRRLQEEEQQRQQQQEINEQLTELQTWDVTHEEQTRVITRHEENVALQQAALEQVPAIAQVEAVAEGEPVQTVATKKTYKQRRRDRKHDKEARKQCPVGDHISYNMRENLIDRQKQKENALSLSDEQVDEMREKSVDPRLLFTYSKGYRTNKKGRPLTADDAQKKTWSENFQAAYISCDINRREPYLKQFTQEFLTVPINARMLTPEYIEKNTAAVADIGIKFTTFDNLSNDVINRPYFDSLSPGDKALIERRWNVARSFAAAVALAFQAKGINLGNASYLKSDEMPLVQFARQMLPIHIQEFTQHL
jgi:hypothetical protein